MNSNLLLNKKLKNIKLNFKYQKIKLVKIFFKKSWQDKNF